MTGTHQFTRQLAHWAADLKFEGIPRRVLDECKNQVLSVIASVHAGHFSEAGRSVSKIVREWSGGKDATLMPSGERTSLHTAIFGNAALSMALDYDDYLFAGHTGHAAVLCTLAMAEKHGASGKDFLAAQTAANECAGRVGAAAAAGLPNHQLLTIVHPVGAAIAAARVLGLDREQMTSALGLSLQQPCQALQGGFFGSEGKVLLASQAAPIGVMAAEMAAGGIRGPHDIIEHAHGFLARTGPQPLPGAFAGLGTAWLTETLSYKLYPGCAHIDAVVDCVLHLVRSHPVDAKKIKAVHVAAGPLTLGTDALAAPYLDGPQTPPVTLNFSVAYNAAVAAIDKELTPRQFMRERMKDPDVWNLASKVRLTLDEQIARRTRDSWLVKTVGTSEGERADLDLAGADLSAFRMSLGAHVRLEMEDGRTFEADQDVPLGAAGRPAEQRRRAVEEKFRRETRYTLRKEKIERAIDVIEHLEDAASSHVREIVRLCCSERT